MFFRRKSPENTANNAEQAPSDNGAGAEFPPFDPAAAEAAKQQRIAEYKAEHPDAVEDVEKARFMAMAEDPYRTQATVNRREASEHQKEAERLYIKKEQEAAANDWESSVETGNQMISAMGQSAKKRHDASTSDMKAENAGEKAGAFYDNSHKYDDSHDN